MDREISRLAELVGRARRLVAFTGAGVSTESGIPDFRSPGGVWDRFDPNEFTFQNFIASHEGRRRYWELGRTTFPVIRRAEPNPAHHALVTLWRLGRLDCVITQNVDNLHQRAGLPPERVIELHGNATRARCLQCERPYERERIQEWLETGVEVPVCDPPCGGIIKPRTVMFGEAMPVAETAEAQRRARSADLFLVIGSSLVVYPAAYMPLYAKEAGASLAIVNLTPTPHDDHADLVVRGSAAAVMAAAVDRVQNTLTPSLRASSSPPEGEMG
ncbi:MAG TPA: Sir2 family NAD-dependent protein deacetylase [Methylomirabilota bacterium]|nr:Sir2 family NAD-dependent protein deacetylase [Methylomirabilota bacterium]